MPQPPAFVPDRFRSTVAHYLRHRLRYPPALVAEVRRRVLRDGPGRVLDLGCGPGFLAVEFARAGDTVVGLDPDPAMLEAARAEAAAAGVAVAFAHASSYDLAARGGTFDLAAMGRSFHWMDRIATLDELNRRVAPGGAVALFGDAHEPTPENAWMEAVREVARQFSGDEAFAVRRRRPDWVGHVSLLLDSAFSDVEQVGLWERRALTVPEAVGRALSLSSTAPDALGARRGAFEAALGERLAPLAVDDRLTEVVQLYAVVARRP